MLPNQTPFPNVGSYALLIDCDGSCSGGAGQSRNGCRSGCRAELVRIMRVHPSPEGSSVTLAFPLREGASGNKTVPLHDLIDATPLTGAEAREMVDIGRELRGSKVKGRAAKEARHAALQSRAQWATHFTRLLEQARKLEEKRRAA